MVGNTEDANSKETQENWAFLQAVSSTGPFKELHSYLAKKGKVSNSMVSRVKSEFVKVKNRLLRVNIPHTVSYLGNFVIK